MSKKEIRTKEKRHEIYNWIELNVGHIKKEQKGYLKKLLVEYVKMHNEKLVKLNNELYEAYNQRGRIIDQIRGIKMRELHRKPKPIKRDLILS